MNTQARWWFCVKHNRVESDEGGCAGKDKLGPYATREEAERALQTVREYLTGARRKAVAVDVLRRDRPSLRWSGTRRPQQLSLFAEGF